MNTSTEFSNKINRAIGARDTLLKQHEVTSRSLTECIENQPYIEQAQILLQTVAAETQGQLKLHLEDIVATGLETCFPEMYNPHIDFINKRGKIDCDIYLHDRNGNRVNPLDDNGGRLSDIVSFSLRMACWTIGKTDNVIVLDEPFKFLSAELRPLAGELLQNLSKKLKLQIIMITHDEEMIEIADRVFRVAKNKKDVSIVETLN